MTEQYHIIFTGHVQGVGFRFTARDFARELGVTGWVKNLPDGSVEMLAEGEESDLVELLARLKSFFKGNIQGAKVRKTPRAASYTVFEIAF
ncbi:MAG: acylphosphatase [Candidatus Omnitrophica bacterium]|nr:acylphosphatase [Candidatus Omnitrophota bacterium]